MKLHDITQATIGFSVAALLLASAFAVFCWSLGELGLIQ